MKLKESLKKDSYIQKQKSTMKEAMNFYKFTVVPLLLFLLLTTVSSLGVFTTFSYFNTNSKRIEARALASSNLTSEITLKSNINYGVFPNDIFASPDDQISFLQENFETVKTYKIYNAYEEYRSTDLINGFYYHGNPADKPEFTYADRFNERVRYYTNFLCVDNGNYLGIDLEVSSNYKTNDDGTITYKYLNAYIGNEIYLPYKFAQDVILPAYKDGYLKNNASKTISELKDLIDEEITIYSVMSERFAIDKYNTNQIETPRTYIIKGILSNETSEEFSNYFIIPFRSSLLTQPRVFFKPSSSYEDNMNYINCLYKFNEISNLTWGIQTEFTDAINEYTSKNIPAKKVGVFGSLTLFMLLIDGVIYYLFLKKSINYSGKNNKKMVIITTIISIVLSIILGGAIAKIIDGSSLFAWNTSIGKLKTCFFTTSSSILNWSFGLLLIVATIIGYKCYLKKQINED